VQNALWAVGAVSEECVTEATECVIPAFSKPISAGVVARAVLLAIPTGVSNNRLDE
jgi:hypothetical protein